MKLALLSPPLLSLPLPLSLGLSHQVMRSSHAI